MGNKDRTRDGDAAATNRDHSRDREAARDAALAKTITEAVALQTQSIAEIFAKQKSEETQSIAKTVAGALAKQKAEETQSITEAFTRQMEKAHAQYKKLFKESRAATLPTTLKATSSS